MITWLDNPLVQSALLPFIMALVLARVLAAFLPRWQGLAIPLGFYPAAVLMAGLQLVPFTSTRKILLLGVIAVILSGIFSWRNMLGLSHRFLLAVSIVVATLWVLWPLLMRTDGLALLSVLGSGLIYMLWLTLLIDAQRLDMPVKLLNACVFSAGVAVVATIGGSALLGQLSGALAAATGGVLLVVFFSRKPSDAQMFMFPVMLMAGLLSLAAVVYASLPWRSLLCLMAIPLVSLLPLSFNKLWLKLLIQLLLMLMAVAGAVYIAWDFSSNLALDNADNGYY